MLQNKLFKVGLLSVFVFFAIVGMTIIFADNVGAQQRQEGCMADGCHVGIENIAPVKEMSDEIKKKGECTVCHMGNPNETKDEDIAHEGMYKNPSDLNHVRETCGQCHEQQTENIFKSLHSTMAGMISGARYTWGAQPEKLALYGVKPVVDTRTNLPEHALSELKLIPFYNEEDASYQTTYLDQVQISGNPIDSYLRKQCLRCHLWVDRSNANPGDRRASGCAACHVLYDYEGKSQTADQSIDNTKTGRPMKHEITSKIPTEQCLRCHNRGGRTGVSFIGHMEADYSTPYRQGGADAQRTHGRTYNKLQSDHHYAKGLECIDCHTGVDVMGDGYIYSKKWQQNKTTCETCHSREPGKGQDSIVLKMTGEQLTIPKVDKKSVQENRITAMMIDTHMERLECYTCHAQWTPQCYGCHAQLDERESERDLLTGQTTTGKWKESRSYLRWEQTIMGINYRGNVSPFIPGCQAVFTHIDKDGNTVELNKIYTVYDSDAGMDLPGWALNPIQPHTMQRNARTCEDCHTSRKALGLGSGYYNTADNGLPISIEPDQLVTRDGVQVQTISHPGARPFTAEEIARISRQGTCEACHARTTDDTYWSTVVRAYGMAKTPEYHSEVLKTMLHDAVMGKRFLTSLLVFGLLAAIGFKGVPLVLRRRGE